MENKSEKKSFWRKPLGRDLNALDDKATFNNTKKTTTKIKFALLELLREKEFSQINITDLVKVAGIYRATFYLHYKSLNDVILDIEQDIYECYNTIRAQMEDVDIYNNMSLLIEVIGDYIQIDKKYLKVIINTNCFNRLTLKLKELLYDIVVNNFTKFGHMCNDDEFKLNISMFTGGLVFAYRDWVNNLDMELIVLQDYVKNISDKLFKKINN